MSHPITVEFDKEAYANRFVGNLYHDLRVAGMRPLITHHWTDDLVLFVLARNEDTGQEVLFEVWPTRSSLWDGLETNVTAAQKLVERHTTKAVALDPSRRHAPLIERPRVPW